MKNIFLISLFLLLSGLCAQNNTSILKFNFPDSLPEKYILDIEEKVVDYFIRNPESKDHELSIQYIKELETNYRSFFKSPLCSKNETLENYLNAILKKVVPDSIIEQNNLRIYLSNEDGVNASAGEQGTIIFHIYNFNYFKNESEIAFILAHEVAHVLEKNGVEMMVLYDRFTKTNPNALINNRKKQYEKASRESEMMADKMACTFLSWSGYNNNSGEQVFDLFKRIEQKNKMILPGVVRGGLYLNTHPLSKIRRDSVNEWLKEDGGNDFLVSKNTFKQIKNEVTSYILKFLFDSHQYEECIELALEGYFYNQDNRVIYYIIEPIRRLIIIDKKLINKPLLSKKYKVGLNYGIPHHSKKIFIKNCDSLILHSIKTKKLYSYHHYLDYFITIAKDKKIENCILSIGLYNYKQENSNEYLHKYLKSNQKKYQKYISYILDPIKNKFSYKEKMLVYNEVHYERYNRYGFPVGFKKEEDTLVQYFNNYVEKKYAEISNKSDYFYSLGRLKEKKFNQYYNLQGLFSFFRILDDHKINTKKNDPYLINPDLWIYMDKNKISRLDFIDMFKCRNGQKALQIIAASQGFNTGPIWTYSISLYSLNNKTGSFKLNSYDIGTRIRKRHTFYVLSNYVFNKKNYSLNN